MSNLFDNNNIKVVIGTTSGKINSVLTKKNRVWDTGRGFKLFRVKNIFKNIFDYNDHMTQPLSIKMCFWGGTKRGKNFDIEAQFRLSFISFTNEKSICFFLFNLFWNNVTNHVFKFKLYIFSQGIYTCSSLILIIWA